MRFCKRLAKRSVNRVSAIFSFVNLFLNMQRGQTRLLSRYSFACLLAGW